ncbi:hypothetical protein NEOLEDRAFT_1180584 [Neolentinus lepideus HHB14362 ss-1]|uniref:Uncharacterized protein n=1 Tax=Neolentinus lepideus HHB14362 ss-1 TaxID=1314782 RepID=A0A165QSW1_9AGAM|nr:hypothetical protein NEOLEDRAFT_1180584 [Neolentinus lepideus HHB14362 ss-1]
MANYTPFRFCANSWKGEQAAIDSHSTYWYRVKRAAISLSVPLPSPLPLILSAPDVPFSDAALTAAAAPAPTAAPDAAAAPNGGHEAEEDGQEEVRGRAQAVVFALSLLATTCCYQLL